MSNDNIRELRILHVEDSDTDAYAVERALSRDPNERYELHRASRMEEAESLLRNGQIWDLVLLDLELPDSKGRTETFQRIAKAKHGDVPVLVLTSINDHDLALDLVGKGVEDYVRKSTISSSPEMLHDAIVFAISRHKNFNSLKVKKEKELDEKNQIIQWMSGGYSIQ